VQALLGGADLENTKPLTAALVSNKLFPSPSDHQEFTTKADSVLIQICSK